MYIKKVHIENFRNFRKIDIPLKQYSTIVGENDVGKSNFLDAIKLLLYNNSIQFYSKRLSLTDLNSDCVEKFRKKVIECKEKIKAKIDNKEDLSEYYNDIPKVIVSITFVDASDDYQKKLLCDWTNLEEGELSYTIEYCFKPKDNYDFLVTMFALIELDQNSSIPIELYEYSIYSKNNEKPINSAKYKNFNVSIINAERDNFSENSNKESYKLISSLLEKKLSVNDKGIINKAYNDFFEEIKKLSSYKDIFSYLKKQGISNIDEIVDNMELLPNFPNLNTIFTNINIGYGNEFLYQKGLGKRNLILLLLLFSNYNNFDRKYNLICVEEPEAHLCVNNLNIALRFIEKSLSVENPFCQTIITSHNPKTINKLKFENVVILKNDKTITFDNNIDMSKYLSKRQNFDILKILFANRLILVEGPTEEMFINTIISLQDNLNDIEVISIGHKGFKTFLDIWLKINKDSDKKIGIVRDYDDQPNAKKEHDAYNDDKQIFVRTTEGYTFEDDLISTSNNKKILSRLFDTEDPCNYMKSSKAESMLLLCERMLLSTDDNKKIEISIPKHIEEILNGLQN